MKRLQLVLAAAFLLAGMSGCRPVTAADAGTSARTVPLVITAHGRSFRFTVEVARTPAEQERGLMFRTHIPRNGGMIFPLAVVRVASFWMKNCPVPEDMIFIRADGSIARIARDTTPYSTEPISSGEPIAAVLELAGGRTAELGISEDDTVTWPR